MKHKNTILQPLSLLTFLLVGLLFMNNTAMAANLVDVYQLAEGSDPQFKQAEAGYRATLESKPQARALLLPSVNVTANTTSNDQEISSASFGNAGDLGFNSHGYSLNLTQPIFRRDRFLALAQAETGIKQAVAQLEAARQDLMFRVAERYFAILSAKDDLAFTIAAEKSLSRQLEQAQQRFDVGLIAITDVQEAQAGYDRAVAAKIVAENRLDSAQEALRETTGEYIAQIATLGQQIALVSPEPAQIEEWTNTAIEQNLNVIATRHATETARQEIRIQRSGHYPTLDLVASHGYNKSGGRFGGTKIHSNAIGLELAVPIYEGGLVNSRTRQAYELYEQALQSLEQARRAAQRSTREAYLGVISGISQVKALKQALLSSETALEATEAGFEVGTRTAVDVVAAERNTFQARRDYASSRYVYILDTLRLKQAAGTLSLEDLNSINNWLE